MQTAAWQNRPDVVNAEFQKYVHSNILTSAKPISVIKIIGYTLLTIIFAVLLIAAVIH